MVKYACNELPKGIGVGARGKPQGGGELIVVADMPSPNLEAIARAMGVSLLELEQALNSCLQKFDSFTESLRQLQAALVPVDTGCFTRDNLRSRDPRPDNRPFPLSFYAVRHEHPQHCVRNGGLVGAYQDRQRVSRQKRIRRMLER